MAYAYTTLTADDRRQIAEGQVRQFEGELFAHELNLARLEAIPAKDRDEAHARAVEAAVDATATIEQAISVTAAEAEKLKAE